MPFPQTGGQSAAQLGLVSPDSHIVFPQEGGQSDGQLELFSFNWHKPSPQYSFMQLALQPSLLFVLPSSHCS